MRYIFLIMIIISFMFDFLVSDESSYIKEIRKDLIKIKEFHIERISKKSLKRHELEDFLESNDCIIKEIGIASVNAEELLKDIEGREMIKRVMDDCCKNVSIALIDKLKDFEVDEEILSKILEKSKDDDRNLRYFAIFYLTDKPKRIELNLIKNFINDNYWRIRERIIHYLIKYGDKSIEDIILKGLEDEKEEVQIAATKYFIREKNIKSIEPLKKLLKSRNFQVIKSSIIALGNQEDPLLFDDIKEFAFHEDYEIRRNAVLSLGKIHNKNSILFLENICKDKKLNISTECKWAIENLKKE